MSGLLDLFPAGRPVITDGGMATELQRFGLRVGVPSDSWTLERPEAVAAVGRLYAAAGSRVLLTNTFRSNPIALEAMGLADRVEELNRKGVELARDAGGPGIRVFGSVGPLGPLHALEVYPRGVVVDAFRRQVEALAEAGAEAVVFETFGDLDEAECALESARTTGLPTVVSFMFGCFGDAAGVDSSMDLREAAARMAGAGVDAIGANCGTGPEEAPALVARLCATTSLPIWIKPSLGTPIAFSMMEAARPRDSTYHSRMEAASAAGATFIGGCCGVGPALIRQLARRIFAGSHDAGEVIGVEEKLTSSS